MAHWIYPLKNFSHIKNIINQYDNYNTYNICIKQFISFLGNEENHCNVKEKNILILQILDNQNNIKNFEFNIVSIYNNRDAHYIVDSYRFLFAECFDLHLYIINKPKYNKNIYYKLIHKNILEKISKHQNYLFSIDFLIQNENINILKLFYFFSVDLCEGDKLFLSNKLTTSCKPMILDRSLFNIKLKHHNYIFNVIMDNNDVIKYKTFYNINTNNLYDIIKCKDIIILLPRHTVNFINNVYYEEYIKKDKQMYPNDAILNKVVIKIYKKMYDSSDDEILKQILLTYLYELQQYGVRKILQQQEHDHKIYDKLHGYNIEYCTHNFENGNNEIGIFVNANI